MPARFWTAIGSRRSGHSSGLLLSLVSPGAQPVAHVVQVAELVISGCAELRRLPQRLHRPTVVGGTLALPPPLPDELNIGHVRVRLLRLLTRPWSAPFA